MARPLLGALFCASASHRLARKAGRGPGRPSWAVPPRSDAAEAPAPAPEDPRDQQDDDGADDRAQDEQDDNERQHVRNDTPVPGMLPRSATGRAGPGNGAGLASLTPVRYGAVAGPVV